MHQKQGNLCPVSYHIVVVGVLEVVVSNMAFAKVLSSVGRLKLFTIIAALPARVAYSLFQHLRVPSQPVARSLTPCAGGIGGSADADSRQVAVLTSSTWAGGMVGVDVVLYATSPHSFSTSPLLSLFLVSMFRSPIRTESVHPTRSRSRFGTVSRSSYFQFRPTSIFLPAATKPAVVS